MNRETRLALRLMEGGSLRVAAKQDLVNLGYPEIIARLLYEKYGKLAPLIAEWFKQYKLNGSEGTPNWWMRAMGKYGGWDDLHSLTYVYEHGTDPESFLAAANHEDLKFKSEVEAVDQEVVNQYRLRLADRIREKFFDEYFFTSYTLIEDITSGKLKDVAAYRRLPFMEAVLKYDQRRYFEERTPIVTYENGFRWIDVGKSSTLLSQWMKNCGSAGLMSWDEDRTIVALFGPTNKPHVMVTYSPNEKRISGDECAGSSQVKPEYHRYVLDLAEHLSATFDVSKTKSTALGVKYLLRNKAQSIEQLDAGEDPYDSYFRFVMDGKVFYTNGNYVISEADMERAQGMIDRGELKVRYELDKPYETFLNSFNRENLVHNGIPIPYIRNFLEE